MGVHPNSLKNLQPEKYHITKEARALITNNSRKGIPNRKTVISRILEMQTKAQDFDGNENSMSVEDAIIVAMVRKAKDGGDVNAAHLLLDGKYGKVAAITETPPESGPDMSGMSEKQLRMIAEARRMYLNAINNTMHEDAEVVSDSEGVQPE